MHDQTLTGGRIMRRGRCCGAGQTRGPLCLVERWHTTSWVRSASTPTADIRDGDLPRDSISAGVESPTEALETRELGLGSPSPVA